MDAAGPTLSIKTFFCCFYAFFVFSCSVFPEIQKRDNRTCPDGKSFLMYMFVICTYIYIQYIYVKYLYDPL